MKKVVACLLFSSISFAQEKTDDCGLAPHPYTIDLRHIEGKGIGYDQGYTTLDGHFHFPGSSFAPFLDLRGHLFDNGKWAANGGIGCRYLSDSLSTIFGLNAYYDFRQTHKKDFQQVGTGLEVLWSRWELRANGYFPISARKTHFFDVKFDEFKGNNILLKGKRDFSLMGGDAELGVYLKNSGLVRCYAGAGPYYLASEGCKDSWGGKGRFKVDISKYFFAEVNGSYDSIFHGIVQGQLAFSVPFGPRKKVSSTNCGAAIALQERLVEQPERAEIIAVERCKKKMKAIDPSTGNPYTVWFVNNTSSSAGTFESPFPTLSQAERAAGPGDIIYVFPGNGSLYDGGIVLKDNQMLFGSAIRHYVPTQFGNMKIPPYTGNGPFIGNTMGTAILLANNNTIEGINIQPTADAVDGTGINNLIFSYNQISPINTGVTLTDVSGQVTINNNRFFTMGTGGVAISVEGNVDANMDLLNNDIESCSEGIQLNPTTGILNMSIVNNTINGSVQAFTFGTGGTCQGQITLENNKIYGSDIAFDFSLSNNSQMGLNLINNEVLGFTDFEISSTDTSTLNLSMIGNEFVGQDNLSIIANLNSTMNGVFENNTLRSASTGITIQSSNNAQSIWIVTNNTFSVVTEIAFVADTMASMCLRYQNNQMPLGTPVLFINAGAGQYNLEPLIGNTGFLIPPVGVTNVPSGTCN